jgi:hypothetical protein
LYTSQLGGLLFTLEIMSKPKSVRNKKLINLRRKGLSFAELGRIFNISRITAYKIVARKG